jgi:hypothetical protein
MKLRCHGFCRPHPDPMMEDPKNDSSVNVLSRGGEKSPCPPAPKPPPTKRNGYFLCHYFMMTLKDKGTILPIPLFDLRGWVGQRSPTSQIRHTT